MKKFKGLISLIIFVISITNGLSQYKTFKLKLSGFDENIANVTIYDVIDVRPHKDEIGNILDSSNETRIAQTKKPVEEILKNSIADKYLELSKKEKVIKADSMILIIEDFRINEDNRGDYKLSNFFAKYHFIRKRNGRYFNMLIRDDFRTKKIIFTSKEINKKIRNSLNDAVDSLEILINENYEGEEINLDELVLTLKSDFNYQIDLCTYKNGVYFNRVDFLQQRPIEEEISINKNEDYDYVLHDDVSLNYNGKTRSFSNWKKHMWGFCKDGVIYVNLFPSTGHEIYAEVNSIGDNWLLSGKREKRSTSGVAAASFGVIGSIMASAKDRKNQNKNQYYLYDINVGRYYGLNLKRMYLSLKKDGDLLSAYRKNPNRGVMEVKVDFIRQYNEKYFCQGKPY